MWVLVLFLKQPITAHGVAEVVASDDPEFEKGDLVEGAIHWALYSVVKPGPTSPLNKLNTLGFPLTYHLGILRNLDHSFNFYKLSL